ncbi:DUF5005 domain-containing protein [Actinomadura barringtoniae]|uniref:DUF5005 domain-containing protein n=1 Tax=Actinomadura barringtoniae TaxID=1427535 RepID=A0A939PIA6_9ACTN|nr:DUF5005 domain-containing protein [Actinomadura barringtoniae]MBO2450329.1 DUF5005 domain-containing protein [Actinomadura barringtoniae]
MRFVPSVTAASTLLAAALLVPATSANAAHAAAAAAALTCNGSAAPTIGTGTPNTSMNNKFTSYGNSNALTDDWTGADSTYSVKLADGRTVFGFSDTFLGTVNANGSRPLAIQDGGTTPFINNTFVVQSSGGTLSSTAHGGTASSPTALLPPRDDSHLYWAGDLTTNGSTEIQQPYREYKVGSGDLNVAWEDNVLARFSTSNLKQPISITPLPSSRKIMWGSGLMKADGYTYIYGTEDLGTDGKHMYVARVSGTDLRGQWSYLASYGSNPTDPADDTWSTSESAALRVLSGVSNEFSVSRRGNFNILLTQDTKLAFSMEIDTYLSCSPAGPFGDEKTVYNTPIAKPDGTPYNDADLYTYNAHAHASLSSANNLVFSYNMNSLDFTTPAAQKDVYRDVSIYRPRFVNVPVTG